MVYNRFSIVVILLSILLGLTSLAFVWILLRDYLVITKLSFGGIWLLVLAFLIYYVQRTNRELIRFLDNLRYLDKLKNNKEKDASFHKLNRTFNKVIETIKEIKYEHEAEHQYFRHTVEHIPVGLIAYEKDGKIQLINKAAKELMQKEFVKHYSDLNISGKNLGETLFRLKPGQNELIKVQINSDLLHLSVRAVNLRVKNKSIKLVSLQNIQNEMEAGELEAWQKLIRVMTHEIMNSVSPVKSLTYSMQKLLRKESSKIKQNSMNDEILETILSGLEAIEKRSKGLQDFVKNYKDLTALPFPDFRVFRVNEMFKEVAGLLQEELSEDNIELKMNATEPELTVKADYKLISQVIINLIQNSHHALSGKANGVIELNANKTKDNNMVICIKDNGRGIPWEERDKIFIPFYSTRKGGSGIGLSFARQVIQMHNGRLFFQSAENKYTEFTLVL
jgi:nitrogen fixation/metabolism regulation signal transduction histidine kinase